MDATALTLAFLLAAAIAAALLLAHRGDNTRRGWLVAAALVAGLFALGLVDVLPREQRDIHMATLVFGAVIPVLGATGLVRGTRGVRPWIRWSVVFLSTVVLLFGGLLIGATIVPRFSFF